MNFCVVFMKNATFDTENPLIYNGQQCFTFLFFQICCDREPGNDVKTLMKSGLKQEYLHSKMSQNKRISTFSKNNKFNRIYILDILHVESNIFVILFCYFCVKKSTKTHFFKLQMSSSSLLLKTQKIYILISRIKCLL